MDSSSLPPDQGGDSPTAAGGVPRQEPVTQPQPTGAPYYQPPPPPARGSRLAPWMAPVLVVVAVALVIAGVGVGLALSRNNNAAAASINAAPVATLPVTSGAQDLQSQIINVIHAVQPTVVQVESQSGRGQAIGSGEIVSSDGYIVTNDHVVRGFTSYSVLLSNGKSYPATLVGEAPGDDLAVLKVSTGTQLQTIAFGESKQAQVGQFVIALGSPLGLTQSATFGIVSALNRTASEGAEGPAQELTGLIQTSAPINPGNSGGALVNLKGELIGVPTLGAVDPSSGGAASGIGFAIPSDRVQYVMAQLIQYGHVVNTGQGFMGIQGEDVTPQIAASYNLGAQSGVLVVGFANAASGVSPAQAAGLKQGDIITGVDDQTISDNSDLASALLSKSPGTKVKITYVRGTATSSTQVTL
ncbi:MAG TPA: trypsin-like peptidase domain-containing protein, partial [Ktedonobacterales bacterium]